MPDLDKKRISADFSHAVNMTPSELEKWLKSPESLKVGFKGKDGRASESVGHASGRRIVKILRAKKAELTDSDYAHMRKVVGYVRRHLAQEPANKVSSRW